MQSEFQVPFIVTFMFIIFPLFSFCSICFYYRWAIKRENEIIYERRDEK